MAIAAQLATVILAGARLVVITGSSTALASTSRRKITGTTSTGGQMRLSAETESSEAPKPAKPRRKKASATAKAARICGYRCAYGTNVQLGDKLGA